MQGVIVLCLLIVFCSVCIMAGPVLPDPFARPPRVAVQARQTAFVLQGVMGSGKNMTAAITCGHDQEVVMQGAMFKGYTVKKVTPESVLLEKDNEQIKLVME